jgi:phosphomannomutase
MGIDVVDVGILPTPMIYYAKNRLRAAGCAMVTGSHHAASINGLKWMVGEAPPTNQDVLALQRAAEEDLNSTEATKKDILPDGGHRSPTKPRQLDVSFDYVACLQEQFVDSLGAELHVVLDPMLGCWAGKVRRYLNAIFPYCLFSTIHNVPTPDFDAHTPDCAIPSESQELCDAVYRERAHLGIAFDGDGDRLALIDNEGVALTVDETAWVLLQTFGQELSGERFVHDVKLSDRIVEAARQNGAEPIAERCGSPHIRTCMQQTQALFGVETGGHYFYRKLDGDDDSLYTACRLIAWMAEHAGQSLGDLRRRCPPVYITPDLHIPLATELHVGVMEQIRKAWAQFPQQTTDGIRINTPSGWILATRSVTAPSLTFRFEGANWAAVDHLVERFCRSLPELGDILWQRYKSVMGIEDNLD